MMLKTPVSILQEMMTKEQIVPNYDLIHNGGGTHINTFTYQVRCGEYVASGTGRSKKDAKHEAAEAMLRTIAEHRNYPQLPETPVQSPVRTPLPPTIVKTPRVSPSEPFINYVGKLQDLCADNNLQSPEYIQISDVGPPHARIFTIQCKVATFKESGAAKTKKQAKQDAAKEMLDKLNYLMLDVISKGSSAKGLETDNLAKSINMAKSSYSMLAKSPVVKKVTLGVKLNTLQDELKNSLDTKACEQLNNELNFLLSKLNCASTSVEVMADLRSELEKIMSSHGWKLSINEVAVRNQTLCALCMRIDAFPEIVQFGIGATLLEAEIDATEKLIQSLLLLLK